jgi:carboxypeptidase family protein
MEFLKLMSRRINSPAVSLARPSRALPARPGILLTVALALLVFLAGASSAWAQATTSVRGTVTDPSGSAVVGANVTLANPESKTERTTTTGTQGEYQFLLLSPGTYTLRVSATGFAGYEQTGLQLLVSTPATANIQLKLGQSTQSVTVTSEAPALNMVDASLGNSFDQTQVMQIPLDGRNVPELLSLQAGVAYTGNREDMQLPAYKDQDTRSGSVNGARSDQSNITLDGVDVNDQSNGYAFTSVLPTTQDSVQEFRVTTTNYDAEQGVGSGAQVSLVTKSGTNNFHGSLYEYNRFTATSANDYLIKRSEFNDGQPNKPLKLIRNVFGTSVGGPLHKDRLFFFANYEGTRRREEQNALRTVPSASLRDGVILYQCADPTTCPGGTFVKGISGAKYPVQPGVFGISPQQITALDPLSTPCSTGVQTAAQPNCAPTGYNGPVGPNPVMLNYFNQTYGNTIGNDNSVGDGFNYVGSRFRAPVSLDDNVFIARLDYHLTQNGKHLLFWRGALHNLSYPQAPFLLGAPPQQTILDHSKGFVVGYTAVLNSTTANTFHWGFTRESTGFAGNTNQPWNTFVTLDQGINYSHNFQVPVHNLLDDFSWTKAGHTFQFGTNIGFVRDPRASSLHSFNTGEGATFWMFPVGFANTFGQSPLDPINALPNAFPEPASSTAYDFPMLGLLGMVSLVKTNINYDRQGNVIPEGTPIKRNWGLDWYEFYGQDSWRVKPNLTVTYGLRWSLFPPPWEVNGLQASPTCSNAVAAANGTPTCPPGSFNLGKYFNQNLKNMENGLGYADAPLVSYILGGSANNGPGLYHFEKTDFSPRFSVAYSPRPQNGWLKSLFGEGDKTVIRAGFGTVYDRPGMQILNTFDSVAPAGLSSTLENACCIDGAGQVPRITDLHVIPTMNVNGSPYIPNPLPSGAFPQTPMPFNEAITWGIDQSLKTPYAYAIDFSVGRELPKGFSLQLSYVGRLGRRLLTQRDLAQPLDLVDPKTKIDYFQAASAISKLARSQTNPLTPTLMTQAQFDQALGPTVAYWQDLVNACTGSFFAGCTPTTSPGLATGATAFVMPLPIGPNGAIVATPTRDIAQAAYALYVTSGSFAGDEVVGLGNIDLFGHLCDNAPPPPLPGPQTNPACLTGGFGNSYFFNGKTGEALNQQLTTDFAWSSVGRSNYNGLQVNLRKRLSHGVQFDLNYTYSKSIDFTSGAARLGFSGTDNIGAPGSRLVNAFRPQDVRSVSDFDTTHQINANWIADLPFGKDRHFGHNSGGFVDAVIGGWQLSGLARWTSGFPFTIDNGSFWATNWDEQGSGQLIAIPKTGVFKQPDGTVSVFANPAAALNDYVHPFPGQSGSRNVLRGDGFASWDMNLSKRWKMPYAEGHSLQFRWEIFNVANLTRFNVQAGLGDATTSSLQSVPSTFGDYTGLLTQPRVMQFALRYEF